MGGGLIDGPLHPVCRTQKKQRTIYNGDKRIYLIKFESVVALNGLFAMLDRPCEGRKLDIEMLAHSGLTN